MLREIAGLRPIPHATTVLPIDGDSYRLREDQIWLAVAFVFAVWSEQGIVFDLLRSDVTPVGRRIGREALCAIDRLQKFTGQQHYVQERRRARSQLPPIDRDGAAQLDEHYRDSHLGKFEAAYEQYQRATLRGRNKALKRRCNEVRAAVDALVAMSMYEEAQGVITSLNIPSRSPGEHDPNKEYKKFRAGQWALREMKFRVWRATELADTQSIVRGDHDAVLRRVASDIVDDVCQLACARRAAFYGKHSRAGIPSASLEKEARSLVRKLTVKLLGGRYGFIGESFIEREKAGGAKRRHGKRTSTARSDRMLAAKNSRESRSERNNAIRRLVENFKQIMALRLPNCEPRIEVVRSNTAHFIAHLDGGTST